MRAASIIGLICGVWCLSAHAQPLATYYVNVANPNPVLPYRSWATAARSIQDAVGAGTEQGRVVLVTNGIYRAGSVEAAGPNRVALTNQVMLRSVNGPAATVIDGGGSVRCVYLATDAVISGFTLTNGLAGTGGGAYGGTLTNCMVTGNSADGAGGGACNSTLYNCTLSGNTAYAGYAGYAVFYVGGGGASSSTLHNCTLIGNSGAGADFSTLYNCTLTENSGVGANASSLYNCIDYGNRTPYGGNHSGNKFEYSCTIPWPLGPGNTDLDPQLASGGHLWPCSPCLGAGSANYASGVDIDGEPWSNPPPMGADQLISGSTTGALGLRIEASHTEFAAGYAVSFKAQITGRILSMVWDFGDGTVATNRVSVSHAWTAPGVYTVRLTGYNDSFPAGVTSTVQVEVINAVYYVNVANPNPVFPYTSWATAATNIQAAVAAGAEVGRLVLVSNGVYRTGSVETNGLNRVALTNAVVLRSVNGPSVTLIEGAPGPDYPEESIRCVYVGDGALVSGFTLTNGVAWEDRFWYEAHGGGGACCEPLGVLTNCVLTGNSAGFGGGGVGGGGAYGGTLYDCTLTGNSASSGGGASGGTLYDCTLADNSAIWYGGGVCGSTLYNCVVRGNTARWGGGVCAIPSPSVSPVPAVLYNCTLVGNTAPEGGGVYGCTLYNCTVMGNTAGQGGGVYARSGFFMHPDVPAVLYNCTLVGNTAQEGGGAYGELVELYNCIVRGNTARWGGGVSGGTIQNCVVTENSADEAGGVTGAWVLGYYGGNSIYYPSQLRNCIVYFNHALSGANYGSASFEYSCTTPLPEGPGNIDAAPQLAWDNHLLPTSPCVAAGNAAYATGRDIDGEPWANPPSMGADQFVPGPGTGALTMQIQSDSSQVAPGYVVLFMAQNTGRLVRLVWDFGDGTVVTNRAFVSHAWDRPGIYTIGLTGYNDSFPAGVTSTVQIEVVDAVHYVNVANLNPVFPYASWAAAATNIQDAVTASTVPGRLVLVTNGVYRTGVATANGTNRVALTNRLVLRSVNGPDVTTIEGASGDQPVRCAYVGNRAVLSGFTLSRGKAEVGGGVYGQPFGVVTNCTLSGNTAYAAWNVGGGGASSSTLHNCTLTGNSGGGASGSTLYNCLVTDNGGGSDGLFFNCTVVGNNGGVSGKLFNSIVYYNSGGNYAEGTTLNYSCTTPLPEGPGNIDSAPQLVWDLHLLPTSPCVAAGNDAYAIGRDIDGEPWANPPCMGADQVVAGPVTGALTMQIHSDFSQVAPGYVVLFMAQNTGRLVRLVWDFGDGTVVTNQPHISHAWGTPGNYIVRLTGYNANYPEGVTTTAQIEVIDAVHYVNVANLNPVFPYASWVTAATNIQDAVTASTVPGRLVLVTNGVYRTGVTTANGTNRVALTNTLVLRSVNGPAATIIHGGGTVRCVFLGPNTVISGFTMTSGSVGGVMCANATAVVTNCIIAGNAGDGASGGTLYNCTVSGNLGSGASEATLYDCTLTGNWAVQGGGARDSTLYNCRVTGNSASYGGGTLYSTLYNCTVTGNSATEWGSSGGTLYSTLYNCTVTGNSGGGARGSTIYNSIIYYNSGGNYAEGTTLNYSCTTPLPEGPGNIDWAPQLVWDLHLLPTSPCVAAGNDAYAIGRDIDGEPWANPPCMGADQVVAGPVTGALTMQIHSDFSQVAPGYVVLFMAQNTGRLVRLVWDFGDGTFITNQPHISHAWATPGNYTVRLTGYNDSFPAGVTITVQVEVIDAVHYVNVANLNPVFPYASWVTAATKIQDAVTASTVPGRLVLVTNGVYRTGVTTANGTNRVALTNTLVLRSVNGPAATIIHGGGTVRCVFLGPNTVISGFTMTSGSVGGVMCANATAVVTNCIITGNAGGGVSGGTLYNCTLTGNSADYYGGGAYNSTLHNCVLTGNSAGWYGGGACGSTLYNSTLTGNSGDGASGSTLYNCLVTDNGGGSDGLFFNCTVVGNNGGVSGKLFNSIVYGNTNANYDQNTILNYCLTTPLPTNGVSNIAADPRFVNAAAGDFRLRPDSPCINAGLNAYVSSATDFGGYPRIVSGSVDIGAYEYQGSGSTISYAWLQHYGLSADGSADATDPDADGHNTWQEWRCQTDPTNALSVLRLLTASPAGTNLTVRWQSVAGVNYFLERSTDLSASPPFSLLAPNLPGQPGTTSYADTNAVGAGPFFYRVGVGN